MSQTKWGVIYCPRTASWRAKHRWNKILRTLRNEGIAFDHAVSDSRGAVERLAAMMTKAGYTAIIVVGGDSALNEALNGIIASSGSDAGVKRPSLGIIPNGYGNDFARYWGFEEGMYKEAVRQLMHLRRRKVDVGRTVITTDKSTETRYFLNCANVGLAATLIQLRKQTRTFFGFNTISYLISALIMLFKRMRYKMRFTLNSEEICHDEMTVCVGSATGYGQTPSAVPYNGVLDVIAVSHPRLFQLFNGLWLLFTGRILTHERVKVWRTRQVTFTDTGRATVSLDGKIVHGNVSRIDIDILPEEIDFLIPAS